MSPSDRTFDRPLILVTNDDGYDAPGIGALVEQVQELGRVVVVAPDREQSGASHALTLARPLRAHRVGEDRFRVDGTPTDCVHLGIDSLTDGRLPDLVLSGINAGLNVGDDLTYSGTVAGALEGTLLHVPSVAFSLEVRDGIASDLGPCSPWVRRITRKVLRDGLPPGVLLNVNFPASATFDGLRVTRQGTRRYQATALERLDPSGRPYYWIDSVRAEPTGEPDSDQVTVRDGFISVTPLSSNLTHERSLEAMASWAP